MVGLTVKYIWWFFGQLFWWFVVSLTFFMHVHTWTDFVCFPYVLFWLHLRSGCKVLKGQLNVQHMNGDWYLVFVGFLFAHPTTYQLSFFTSKVIFVDLIRGLYCILISKELLIFLFKILFQHFFGKEVLNTKANICDLYFFA